MNMLYYIHLIQSRKYVVRVARLDFVRETKLNKCAPSLKERISYYSETYR